MARHVNTNKAQIKINFLNWSKLTNNKIIILSKAESRVRRPGNSGLDFDPEFVVVGFFNWARKLLDQVYRRQIYTHI